jgi:hypothetical protein
LPRQIELLVTKKRTPKLLVASRAPLLLAPVIPAIDRSIGRVVVGVGLGMSSASSSSSAASAAAVFPPSPQTPPPLVVENLPPLNQLSPVAAAPASEQLCYVHCHLCDTVLVVRDRTPCA